MKKICLLLVSLLLFLEVSAQEKRYVSFSLGMATPKGDLTSKELYNGGGFAKTGANFDVAFNYDLIPNFGLGAVLRGQHHGLDAQSMSEEIGQSNKTETGKWNMIALMIGFNTSIPITEKLYIDINMAGGIANFYSPEIKVSFTSPGGEWKIYVGQGSTFSPAAMFAMGFKYDITSSTFILLKGDFLISKPEFDNLEFISTVPSAITTFGNSMYQKFTTVSVNAGIGLRF